MKTSEVLNRAADDLQVNGWTTGNDGMRVAGPHCVLGGIAAVTDMRRRGSTYDYPGGIFGPANADEAMRTLGAHLGLPDRLDLCMSLFFWNDNEERTAEQVIATLRAAAVIEAAKESADETAADRVAVA